MIHLFVQGSKYAMLILFLIYTFDCFYVFRFSGNHERQRSILVQQRFLIILIHLDGNLILLLTNTEKEGLLGFYMLQILALGSFNLIYHRFYKRVSSLLINNTCCLLAVGMIMLTRLNYDKAIRQYEYMLIGMTFAVLIPGILQKVWFLRYFWYLYAAGGVGLLAAVAILGQTSYGAKLSLTIFGITLQPSEFIKILFVFFIAAMLYESCTFKQFMVTSIISAMFVMILVASTDLGGALLYYFTYLMMVFVASRKWYVLAGGTAFMGLASVMGYFAFSHVRTRVIAWLDPLSTYDGAGYQVSQSLFGIGTGGWFGFGLGQGIPSYIPVVENDFMFSAIAEELGGVFALCIIMVYVSCFLMIFNIAIQLDDPFYKMVALGLGSVYALQVFLTIGGAIRFIPSTGVALPLVSYGGSSMLSTMILIAIIQGLYQKRGKSPENLRKEEEPDDISKPKNDIAGFPGEDWGFPEEEQSVPEKGTWHVRFREGDRT